MLKSRALFCRWESCFPAVSVSALLCIWISEGSSLAKPWGCSSACSIQVGNISFYVQKQGLIGRRGHLSAYQREILAPGELTAPFGQYQRHCPH